MFEMVSKRFGEIMWNQGWKANRSSNLIHIFFCKTASPPPWGQLETLSPNCDFRLFRLLRSRQPQFVITFRPLFPVPPPSPSRWCCHLVEFRRHRQKNTGAAKLSLTSRRSGGQLEKLPFPRDKTVAEISWLECSLKLTLPPFCR